MKMNTKAEKFVTDWNATFRIHDFNDRQDAQEDIYIEFRESGLSTDFVYLKMMAESIRRGNDIFVIHETGSFKSVESYSEFFKEYGIETFAYINDSTAALSDILAFMHHDWEVSGNTMVATRFGDEREAIVFKR